jgi:hypothetical protein
VHQGSFPVAHTTAEPRVFFPDTSRVLRALWLSFALLIPVALLFAARSRRLFVRTAPPLVLLATSFALALVAQETDYRDADGWIDCWPHCSALQQATGAGLSYVPALGVLVAAGTIAVALTKYSR